MILTANPKIISPSLTTPTMWTLSLSWKKSHPLYLTDFISLQGIPYSFQNSDFIRRKNLCQIEHTRDRSFDNFIVNMLSALAVYSFFDKKPSINTIKDIIDEDRLVA